MNALSIHPKNDLQLAMAVMRDVDKAIELAFSRNIWIEEAWSLVSPIRLTQEEIRLQIVWAGAVISESKKLRAAI